MERDKQMPQQEQKPKSAYARSHKLGIERSLPKEQVSGREKTEHPQTAQTHC